MYTSLLKVRKEGLQQRGSYKPRFSEMNTTGRPKPYPLFGYPASWFRDPWPKVGQAQLEGQAKADKS